MATKQNQDGSLRTKTTAGRLNKPPIFYAVAAIGLNAPYFAQHRRGGDGV